MGALLKYYYFFATCFPLRLETIEVLSTYVFYSMILVMLILMALFVRIHWNGMNKVLVQPVTRKPPKLVK